MGSMFSGSGMSRGKGVTTSAVLLQEEQAFNGSQELRNTSGAENNTLCTLKTNLWTVSMQRAG